MAEPVTTQNSGPSGRTMPRGRPFQKGQSGNPGGRPKSERSLLIQRYGEDGATLHAQLDALIADKKTPANVKADILKWKTERLGGKTPQTIDVPQLDLVAAALERKVIHELHPGPTKSPTT